MSKILVVDDSNLLRGLLSKHLEKDGHKVLHAANGHEGYKVFKSELPDLVLSDVNMPVWNGFDLCKIIKFDPSYNGTPVALITSSINQVFLLKSIAVGADLFITRPYQESILLTQIKDLIARKGWQPSHSKMKKIDFEGEEFNVPDDFNVITSILLNAYKAVTHQNLLLQKLSSDLNKSNKALQKSENEIRKILTNTMPSSIAEDLMQNKALKPVVHDDVSVIFTDFVGFTKSVNNMSPDELIRNLNHYYSHFDTIIETYKLEKIKSIGDSYLIASGVPKKDKGHAIKSILTALEILHFNEVQKEHGNVHYWPIRIGIYTGKLVAGIIGKNRYAYDIWGATVNVASRIEHVARSNTVLVGDQTLQKIKPFVDYKIVERITDVNVKMYEISGLKKEYSTLETNKLPNTYFKEKILSFS